jgi:hypothetical protein
LPKRSIVASTARFALAVRHVSLDEERLKPASFTMRSSRGRRLTSISAMTIRALLREAARSGSRSPSPHH